MAEPVNPEIAFRRRCNNYQEPEEGEEREEGVLESIITLDPILINQEIVMFFDQEIVAECYTVEELRELFGRGGRMELPLSRRPLGNNFMEQFNAGERTFFIVRRDANVRPIENRGTVIPIDRNILFQLIRNDPERPNPPPIFQRIIDNEEGIRRDVLPVRRVHPHLQEIAQNYRPEYRNIQQAVENNDVNAVRWFLARGIREQYALTLASENNNLEIVRLLLDAGIRNYHSLHVSARNNNMEISRILVEHGVLDYSALPLAVGHNNVDMVRLFLDHGIWSDHAFELARDRNNIEMIELFEQHLNEPHLEQNPR